MRARLKSLYCTDLPDLTTWQPPDPRHFGFWLTAEIGPVDSAGGDDFEILVCTPSWFGDEMLNTGVRHGEHTLFLAKYDYGALRRYVERYVHACEAENWETLARELGSLGSWEYAGHTAR